MSINKTDYENKRKNVLGRGLGALLTDALPDNENGSSGTGLENKNKIYDIDINKIRAGIYQPRKYFDEDKLRELIESINENGIIQPLIVVRAEKDGQIVFDLIAGERRFRAAKASGFKTVPAIIKDISGAEALEIALIENIQRQDLNSIEEAECYLRLIEEFHLTHEELSKKVGKDRATITNMLRMLSLPGDIKKEIVSGRITPSHARNLIGLSDDEAGMLLGKISNEKLTVRDVENEAKILKKKKINKKEDYSLLSQIKKYENDIFEKLGTGVKISYKNKNNEIKGKVEIEFYSSDDLERIMKTLK